MKAFLKHLGIQFRMDLRDKGILLTYYLVPLLFFAIIGMVFSSINPEMKMTLAATMSIFAVTMGAIMGTPIPIVKLRESGTLGAFRVNGIPDGAVLSVLALSALSHLLIVSAVIYFVSPLLLGSAVPANPFLYAASLLLFTMTTIALGLFIGSIARNQSAATMLSMVIFFPTVMLSGIMFPASMLPDGFKLVGRLLPATHALQAFNEFAYGLEPDYDARLALWILAGTGIFAVAGSLWRFGSIRQNEKV